MRRARPARPPLWLVLVWIDALVSPGLDLLTSPLTATGVEVIADRPTHGLPERSRVFVGYVLYLEQRELLVCEPLPGDVHRVRELLLDAVSSRLEREMVRVWPEVQGVVLPRAPLDDPHRHRVLVVLTERHRSGGVVRDLFLGVERGAVVSDRQLVVVEQDLREVGPKLRDDILRVERTQRQPPVVVRDEGCVSLPGSRWSRTHIPGGPITLRTTTGDRDLFQLAGHRRAIARPRHTLPRREGAQAALPELAVQGALIVLGHRSQRFQDPPMRPNVASTSALAMPWPSSTT